MTPPTAPIALLAPLLLLTAVAGPGRARAAEPFSHAEWTQVLQRFVDDRGLVDYQGLAGDRALLDRYVARLERTSPETDPALFPDRAHRLAYYLNAYNAQVFRGVLARGPETETVWTGGFIPGATGYAFFQGMEITIGGRTTSLKELEDEVVRAGFQDPRVHAALNCASLGCPRLPRQAFAGPTLDAELDAAMTEFVGEPRNCAIDPARRTVTLSKIFDWFAGDFLAHEARHGNPGGTVIDYVNRYRPPAARVPRDYSVRFFDYDKRINAQ
jgi:hypothetical protein